MSNQLEHYGVKGMRWGIRRSEAQLGRSGGGKGRSSKDSAHRRQVAKKVAVGAAVVVTAAAAATLYAKNKKQVDAFVSKNAKRVIKTATDVKTAQAVKKTARTTAYVQKNRDKILKSPVLLSKYKDHFDEKTIDKAITTMKRTQELHNLAQNDIRKGANYVQAVLAYSTAATTAYNLKNSQLVNDLKKKQKKKKG